MKKLSLLFILASLLSVSACKKEEEKTSTPGPTLTKTQMLTAKNWKMTLQTIAGSDFLFTQMDACDKDDLYIFKTDGTFIIDEGATKCDPSGDQIIITDTWKFIENETKVYYNRDTAIVSELSSTKMVLKSKFSGEEVVSTYTAQ